MAGFRGLRDLLESAEKNGQTVGPPRKPPEPQQRVLIPTAGAVGPEPGGDSAIQFDADEQRRRAGEIALAMRDRRLGSRDVGRKPEAMSDDEARSSSGTVRLSGELPPLPVHRPMVSPVVALKKETARGYDYTPKATEELYRTPVHLYQYGPETPPVVAGHEPGSWAGLYQSPTSDESSVISVWDRPDWQRIDQRQRKHPSFTVYDPEATLAHEFGHKWYTEQMPEHVRWQWANKVYEEMEGTSAGRLGLAAQGGRFMPSSNGDPARIVTFADPYAFAPVESYADAAAAHNMPSAAERFSGAVSEQDEWDRYYAGLYRDVVGKWQPKFGWRYDDKPQG